MAIGSVCTRRVAAPLVRGSLEKKAILVATLFAGAVALVSYPAPMVAGVVPVAAWTTGELLTGPSRRPLASWWWSSLAAFIAISLLDDAPDFVAAFGAAVSAAGIYLLTRGDAPGELALSWRADRC